MMLLLCNKAPQVELWERNLHYNGRKYIIIEERLHTYEIKDARSMMTTEYDNQNMYVWVMKQLGMWQKEKEEELQQGTSYVIARSNFMRWNTKWKSIKNLL